MNSRICEQFQQKKTLRKRSNRSSHIFFYATFADMYGEIGILNDCREHFELLESISERKE